MLFHIKINICCHNSKH